MVSIILLKLLQSIMNHCKEDKHILRFFKQKDGIVLLIVWHCIEAIFLQKEQDVVYAIVNGVFIL